MLDFVFLSGENSEIIANLIIEILEKNNLENKISAICAGNANTNFGGFLRKETNNVYNTRKLKNYLI